MSEGATPRRELTIQRLIQEHGREYLRAHPNLSTAKTHVLKDLAACRTGEFGTHALRCQECGYHVERPNSCRNRHCAGCGGSRRAEWLDHLIPQLLPTSYLQVVFTLPHDLIPVVQRYPRELYALLFRAAWETLKKLASDPQHLGAKLGAVAVLHTWNQQLQLHPHVHFVLPAGGVSLDGERWVSCRRRQGKHGKPGGYYLFPHKVISRLFRGKFLAGLRKLVSNAQMKLADLPPSWQTLSRFRQHCRELYHQEWVVYQEAPPPNLEPAALVKYLARYVAGSAIQDSRLISSEHGRVTFRVKNRATGKYEPREVSINEFLGRYLLHVLPKGLTRIRHFGFWAPRCAEQRAIARRLCAAASNTSKSSNRVNASPLPTPPSLPVGESDPTQPSTLACPQCQRKNVVILPCPVFTRRRVRASPLYTGAAEARSRRSWLPTCRSPSLPADRSSESPQEVILGAVGEINR